LRAYSGFEKATSASAAATSARLIYRGLLLRNLRVETADIGFSRRHVRMWLVDRCLVIARGSTRSSTSPALTRWLSVTSSSEM
jgi:hypothetical protein